MLTEFNRIVTFQLFPHLALPDKILKTNWTNDNSTIFIYRIWFTIESNHFYFSRHNISGRSLGEASTIETNFAFKIDFQTLFVT